MSEFILYVTKKDADVVRRWINADPDIAWIIKVGERSKIYHWKAVKELDELVEQEYSLWHVKSGALNIPSGNKNVPDALVVDPFRGWTQTLDRPGATAPWFGGNLPGPYLFRFSETGREAPGSLARSGFFWPADRYRAIGKPAPAESKRWWQRLRRFLAKSSIQVPWPSPSAPKRYSAYVFPDALLQSSSGRHRDIN